MLKSSSKKWIMSLLAALTLVVIPACGSDTENQTDTSDNTEEETDNENQGSDNKTLSIGTGPTGSALNSVGSGLASTISTNSSVQMDVKPFSAIGGYSPLINNGEDVLLASATMPELVWSYTGEQGYEKTENLRLLVAGNPIISTGIVVREDAGIEAVADLEGKRVGSYETTPIGNQVVEGTLAANGLSREDVNSVPVSGGTEGIEAIRDGRVDGAYSYAPEAPLVQEVHNAIGLKAIPAVDNTTPEEIDNISQEAVEAFSSRIPSASLTVAEPAGFIQEETVAIEFPIGIGVSSHVENESVYEMVETLWNHYEKLHPTHAWFENWDPELMFDENPSLPYHPGAVEFFKDQDLWTDELEQIQQDLLSES